MDQPQPQDISENSAPSGKVTYKLNDILFNVDSKYEAHKIIGTGAYSVVAVGEDT